MLAQCIPQWIGEGELRSEARGEARYEAQILLKQLNMKFGPPPELVEQKVNTADKAQMDGWIERVLTAERLEDLFQ